MMNSQPKAVILACGLALSVIATSAAAQVAPPPTEPAEKQPTYTPPAKTQPAAQPAETKPTAPKEQEGFTARKRDRGDAQDLPTNVPYPKLAQPGPDGRIRRIRQLPDIAAMRSNPNIGPKSVENIMPVIYARRYKMETAVIDNLDLYWELTGGLIENMNMGNINEMGRVADMMKPLVPEVTLSQDLLNRNLLSRVQGGMNKYIVNEYKKAITDEIQVLDGQEGLSEVMRFVLEDSLHEARLAYQGLMVELMNDVAEVVEIAGIEKSSDVQALIDAEQEPKTTPDEQFAQIAAFDELFRNLSYDEGNAILSALRGTREFENLSPTIREINVLHDRKKVMDAMESIIKDGRTGEELHNSVKEERKRQQEEQGADG